MTPSPIRSKALDPVRHGFFTREGGVSTGIYASLNGGQGSGDERVAVEQNRELIARALDAGDLVTVYQIHSDRALPVTGPWDGEVPQADAMATGYRGIALGALTADCAPVLLADQASGVVGAAHAGWKGALGGVLESVLDAMKGLGARAADTIAVVGPTISQRSYEVGPEFVDRFLDDDPENARFFAGGAGDRSMFDLPGFCLMRLRAAGVDHAEWTGHCTYSDEARFFSYRRACHRGEQDYGRLVSAIAM